MSLVDDYKRQFAWRDWPSVVAALPTLTGTTVLDLGCGVGDVASLLVDHGARVIGVDMNDDLLHAARSRGLSNAVFQNGDLRNPPEFRDPVDGLWSSFTAAYFPELASVLPHWTASLRTGGWIALTEIDDLFGHEPVRRETRELLDAYTSDGLRAGRYDFHMGRKLTEHVARAGYHVARVLDVPDQEFAFQGPARQDVLEGWRRRLDRMKLLHDFCGDNFARVRDDFIACLARDDHRSNARVVCCIATR